MSKRDRTPCQEMQALPLTASPKLLHPRHHPRHPCQISWTERSKETEQVHKSTWRGLSREWWRGRGQWRDSWWQGRGRWASPGRPGSYMDPVVEYLPSNTPIFTCTWHYNITSLQVASEKRKKSYLALNLHLHPPPTLPTEPRKRHLLWIRIEVFSKLGS